MPNSGWFEWVVPPSEQIVPGIEAYGKRVLIAVQAVANYWGQTAQDAARRNARWEDRTSNARSGLFFAVDGFGLNTITGVVSPEAKSQMSDVGVEEGDDGTLVITLGHTVFYGKYLELSHGGTYAIVMSTIEDHLPLLSRLIDETFKG